MLAFRKMLERDKLLLPEEVAEIARVDVQTVRRWLRTKKLRGTKIGRGWRVKESDLLAFIESGPQVPVKPGAKGRQK